MPKGKQSIPLNDYNVYQIPQDKCNEFIDFLCDRQFNEIPLQEELIIEACGFTYRLFFCDKSKAEDSAWVQLLSSCSKEELVQNLKIYGAALICQNKECCFVISYGNAHFYANDYCVYNFGVSVAERLIRQDSITAQQNISHGSKLNRTYYDYIIGASLSYRGGEIPTFIQGKSIDEKTWGKVIKCGTSAQFKWPESPLAIGYKLNELAHALSRPANNPIPSLFPLDEEKDEAQINELFTSLAKAIDEYDTLQSTSSLLNIPSFYLVGTRIVQNDTVRVRITCNYKKSEYNGELSIEMVKDFIAKHNLNIHEVLCKIKVAVEYGNDQWTHAKPLISYTEYVTDGNFCLRDGRWCSFNDAYLKRIFRDVNRISFTNHKSDDYTINKTALIEYAKAKKIYQDSSTQPYETYYNVRLAEVLGGICIHPTTMSIDPTAGGQFKYELCDIYSNDTMYFVKIGSPASFSYAIDQALLTLDQLENKNYSAKLPNGDMVHPKILRFILIFDKRKNVVKSWKDIACINFLLHIIELGRRVGFSEVTTQIDFIFMKEK